MSQHEQGTTRTDDAEEARRALLNDIPVRSRRLTLAGVPTAVLEGGDGPPIVLLHEQGEFAARWMRIIPDLITTHRVVAPDLPGHGGSELGDGALDAHTMGRWLRELIDETCDTAPVLVGHMLGGAVATRFAVDHPERLAGLVLIDSFGLNRFRPTPRLMASLIRYIARPSNRSFDRLYERCAVDLDALRADMGPSWDVFRDAVVAGAKTPALKASLPKLMRQVGIKRVPPADLARITVPTTLIWGRHDPVTKLAVAQAAHDRYGWPLHVIDDAADDPVLEQPAETLRAIRAALTHAASNRSAQ